MEHRILFVDDDEFILKGVKRSYSLFFDIDIVSDPAKALEILKKNNRYTVVVTDILMPQMTGNEFISKASSVSPDTVFVVLSGSPEIKHVTEALNKYKVFKYLTKPCGPDTIITTLQEAIQEFETRKLNRYFLENTLKSVVKVFLEILSISDYETYRTSLKLLSLYRLVKEHHKIDNSWAAELAIMLFNIGRTATNKFNISTNKSLLDKETMNISCRLLSNIQGLEETCNIIRHIPYSDFNDESAPINSQIINILINYTISDNKLDFFDTSKTNKCYNPDILKIVEIAMKNANFEDIIEESIKFITADEIDDRMILISDIQDTRGHLLIKGGVKMTRPLIKSLHDLRKKQNIREPLIVRLSG